MDLTFLREALAGVLPPAVIAAGAFLVAWRPWLRSGVVHGPASSWGAPVAIGLGYAAGHVALHGWPGFVLEFGVEGRWIAPKDLGVKDRLFYVAVVGTLLGVYEAGRQRRLEAGKRGGVSWLTYILVAVLVPVYVLYFKQKYDWEGTQRVLWPVVFGSGIWILFQSGERLSRRMPGVGLPLAWAVLCALAGAALHLSGSASLAQLASALAAPLGVAALIALRRRTFSLAAGGVSCFTWLYGGLLLAGHYAAELQRSSFLLLAAAPLVLWILELPPLAARGPKLRHALGVLLTSLLAGGAVWIESAAQSTNPYYGY